MYTYVQNNPTTLTDPSGEFNLLTSLLEAVTPFVSEALDAGSYLVKDVTRSKPTLAQNASVTQDLKDGFMGAVDALTGRTPGTPGENEAASVDSMLLVGMSSEGAAAGRAVELAGELGKTRDFVTIAVTETKEGVSVVSSSENALRPAVKAALNEGEVAAKGVGHAEVTGVNAAKQMGLTATGVAASRGICPSCAQFLRDVGVAALSALKLVP
jgi:hypothetical protein